MPFDRGRKINICIRRLPRSEGLQEKHEPNQTTQHYRVPRVAEAFEIPRSGGSWDELTWQIENRHQIADCSFAQTPMSLTVTDHGNG